MSPPIDIDLNIPFSCTSEIPDLNLTFNGEDNLHSSAGFSFDLNQAQSEHVDIEVEIHENQQSYDVHPEEVDQHDGLQQSNQHVEVVESVTMENSHGNIILLYLF